MKFLNKDQKGIVFEKTPQNINCIKEYLRNYPGGYFLTIVRNPLYVYNSLLNRKWGNYTALATWLVIASKIIQFLDNDRVILLKYEELVEKPFKSIASIMNKISGRNIDSQLIKKGYQNNTYRDNYTSGLKSWEANTRSGIINANNKAISIERKREFTKILNLKIGKIYANHYNLPEISYLDAIEKLGYSGLVTKLEKIDKQNGIPDLTMADYRKLTMKWLREIKSGHSNLLDWKVFLNAVQPIK